MERRKGGSVRVICYVYSVMAWERRLWTCRSGRNVGVMIVCTTVVIIIVFMWVVVVGVVIIVRIVVVGVIIVVSYRRRYGL